MPSPTRSLPRSRRSGSFSRCAAPRGRRRHPPDASTAPYDELMAERRLVVDHMTIGVTDLDRSREFYAKALEPLGFRVRGPWSDDGKEVSFGLEGADDFAISTEYEAGTGHIAFAADSPDQVRAF